MFSSPNKGRWTLEEKKELYSQIWEVSPTKSKRLILLLNRFLHEKPKVVKTMMLNLCTAFLLTKIYFAYGLDHRFRFERISKRSNKKLNWHYEIATSSNVKKKL